MSIDNDTLFNINIGIQIASVLMIAGALIAMLIG